MKKDNIEINEYRVRIGPMGSYDKMGNKGLFFIPFRQKHKTIILKVIVSDEAGWDHISVSTIKRVPTWDEMCFIKNLFFDEEETVIQYHPKKSEYVNTCKNCLHLWRKQGVEYELPPNIFV